MSRHHQSHAVPGMLQPFQYRRLLACAFLLFIALCGLGYRLIDLQIFQHEVLTAQVEDQSNRTYVLEPRRGDIRDVRGQILATSRKVKTVIADPTLMMDRQPEIARALSGIMGQPETEFLRRFEPRIRVDTNGVVSTNRHVVLARQVPLEIWEQIARAMATLDLGTPDKSLPRAQRKAVAELRKNSISARNEELRVYPNKSLAAHVLGFVGPVEVPWEGKIRSDVAGVEGIERSFNSKLRGAPGFRKTELDARRREVVIRRQQEIPARDGLNVVLTLDGGLQHIVESELAELCAQFTPQSASVIVVRPRTGEILALATTPAFDPNHVGASTADQRRNRAIVDTYEPGSTFKTISVAAAMNDGLVGLNDRIDCERGPWTYLRVPLRDHEYHGVLPVINMVAKSSNIGTAKVALRLGNDRLYHYMRGFGFGQPTGLPLPMESFGILRDPSEWSGISITRIAIGHEASATPIQMAMATAAIANGGLLMRPMLVARLEDQNGNAVARYHPQPVRQVVTPETARQLVEALKLVVSTEGTAAKARLGFFTAGGKTGTAQKVVNGVYGHEKYYSSFIGFFPADRPELLIYVGVDEPSLKTGYYGGIVAAPSFKNIALRAANYLNIRPETTVGDTAIGMAQNFPGASRTN